MRQVIYGYHGTSVPAARAILAGGFRPSNRAYDWLGDGIYFWQDAPERAWEWTSVDRGYGEDATVIAAAITFDPAEWIDLLDIRWERPLRRAFRTLARRYRELGRPLPVQRGLAHARDRAVVNLLVEDQARQGIAMRGARGAFREGRPAYPGSALYSRAHVQIAVRDPAVIQSLWRAL